MNFSGSLFVDSWGWITLASQKESAFHKVKNLYDTSRSASEKIVTTDYILDELITFLYSRAPEPLAHSYLEGLMGSIEKKEIHFERIGIDRFQKAWEMRQKYKDHPQISFTDFTSFVVMKELKIGKVLTNDHHFEKVNLGFQRLPAEKE